MIEQSSIHVSTGDQSKVDVRPQLKYVPVSFFAAVLGLTGATIAWQRAERLLALPFAISGVALILSLAAFLSIATIYALKAARHFDAVKREFAHPVKINFFPTISISLLLFSIAFLRLNHDISRYVWIAGTVAQLVFTIAILSAWMQRSTLQIQHINPAWFIPVVGNIIVPIAGVDHAPAEVSWFFFSFGLIFWIALFTLVLYRLIFHQPPLPERLIPTLFIMMAPPAIGFISYVKLMEHAISGFELDCFALAWLKTPQSSSTKTFLLIIAENVRTRSRMISDASATSSIYASAWKNINPVLAAISTVAMVIAAVGNEYAHHER